MWIWLKNSSSFLQIKINFINKIFAKLDNIAMQKRKAVMVRLKCCIDTQLPIWKSVPALRLPHSYHHAFKTLRMIHCKQCLLGIGSLQDTSIADKYDGTVPFMLCSCHNCQSIKLQDKLNKQNCPLQFCETGKDARASLASHVHRRLHTVTLLCN